MQDQPAGPIRETPISDAERAVVVARIRRAMVDELISFGEIDARFEAIYAADSRADLAVVTRDLPQLPPPSLALRGHPVAPKQLSVFGEIRSSGELALDQDVRYRSVFGSVSIDLSGVEGLPDGITLSASSVFGEVMIILPDGYRVAIEARSVFGSTKDSLSAPLPGAATIRVKVGSVFEDTKVYSLSRVPEGRLRRVWNRLRPGKNSSSG